MEKQCCHCKQVLPVAAFVKSNETKDGLARECKTCRRRYIKKIGERTPEQRKRIHEQQKRARQRRRDKQLAEYREWYQQNRERVLEERRIARQQNPQKYRARDREQRKKHPDRVRANKRNRWARERSARGAITEAEWRRLCDFYGNRCLRCGSDGPLTMDHIQPLARGGSHTIDNVQPLCHSCNSSKQTKTIDYRTTKPPTQLTLW